MKIDQIKSALLLIISIFIIYLMAPFIGWRYEVRVSFVFGLLVILSSCPQSTIKHVVKYSIFLAVLVLARHSLCCWQPWTFLFDHGLYESSPVPFLFISLISSLMGWLLLDKWSHRFGYVGITMGVQILLFIILINEWIDPFLVKFPHLIAPDGAYPGIWEAWQFEWMLVYYLPIYILARKDKDHAG